MFKSIFCNNTHFLAKYELSKANVELRISDRGLEIADCGFGFRIGDCGFPAFVKTAAGKRIAD